MCRVVGCTGAAGAAGPVSAAACLGARLAPGPTAKDDGGLYLSGGELEGARKGATVQPREGVDGQRFPAELLYMARPAGAGSEQSQSCALLAAAAASAATAGAESAGVARCGVGTLCLTAAGSAPGPRAGP